MHQLKKIFSALGLAACIVLAVPQLGRAQWQGLPFRLNQKPYAFFVDTAEDALYIGGFFTTVNDTPCNVLRWDGTAFTRLPLAPCYSVLDITRFQGKLCIGGEEGNFYLDGNQWVSISARQSFALAHVQGKLALIGGNALGDNSSDKPVRLWDGTSALLEDLFGLDSLQSFIIVPTALQEYNGQIYVGGNIGGPNGLKEILRWDGTRWRDVGGGLAGSPEIVRDMAVWNGYLYVAGQYTGGVPGTEENSITRWDGNQWQQIGFAGDWTSVSGLCSWRSRLVAAGLFRDAGGVPAKYLATWDGTRWCGFGSTFSGGSVTQAISFRDTLYVIGSFEAIDGDSISCLARWVGDTTLDTCSDPVVITTLGTHAPVEKATHAFTVSPNPFTSTLTIRALATPTKPVSYTMLDALGRAVHHSTSSTAETTLPLAHLPAGLYILRITDDTGRVQTEKVMKE